LVVQATATHTRHDPHVVPASGRQARYVRLAALPSAVPWARRVLRHMLAEWQLESMADTAVLLVSELVTNAVQASAGRSAHGELPMIGLAIRMTAASLAVWDPSPLRPVRQDADIARDRGRGLLLIDALADSRGHHASDGSKVVWCAVAVASASTSADR